ncbi:uncharacterized protein KIAA1958 homolog [Mercenaria mercenaria]|uniref:uncharacterized protein KIAA1958 homolog n=2 Tax=Mercenaria mercenaria TaxID=6596 RepID=UPI001E1D4469|nr:uncharacterized protein KIAA1958 homolog [Mercenaria mercenaria]XP_045172574.2 uncharacterized protein KIAA1958 homolog [Mercenaria mercenaria]
MSDSDLKLDDGQDIFLSQVLDEIESMQEDDIVLSQALDLFENKESFDLSDSQFKNLVEDCTSADFFGSFTLKLPTGENCELLGVDTHCENRFGKTTKTEDFDALIKDQKSGNTERSTKWATSVFEAWRSVRKLDGEEIPPLEECDINTHLSRFVVEARKQDGSPYPPGSLYNIACGLLRNLRSSGIYDKNFLDETNARYARFREVLDAQMKKLTKDGLGIGQREAKPVNEEDEKILWSKGVFGNSSSVALQHTMYFYNCKFFGLRALDEHRTLNCNQFAIGSDENGRYIEFKGTNSKTYNGGLKHRRIEPKIIRHYDENSGIVDFYEQYLNALGLSGPFYRRPLNKSEGHLRYGEQVVGINKLKTFMKDICSSAGLEGRYTNHSGKKTCATTLYQGGIPEEEIMKRTGHRSTTGVRKYQKPSPAMLKEISNTLNPPQTTIKAQCETVNEKNAESVLKDNDESVDNKRSDPSFKGLFSGNHSFSGCTFQF